MPNLRILLVDDHPLYRSGLRSVLSRQPDLTVVGEASSGEEALTLAETSAPQVTICDISLPGMSGLEATRLLRRHYPYCGVVILTAHEDDEQLFSAIRAGASAYATKGVAAEELIEIIRQVGVGAYLINDQVLARPKVASRMLEAFRNLDEIAAPEANIFTPLTPRELETLESVARGLSNKEVAQALSISDQTVKNHMTSILRKLAVNDRTQAVLYAVRRGWIKLEEGPPEA